MKWTDTVDEFLDERGMNIMQEREQYRDWDVWCRFCKKFLINGRRG